MKRWYQVCAVMLAFVFCGCSAESGQTASKDSVPSSQKGEAQEELLVSAAASLAESMAELGPLFLEKEGIVIRANLAGSGKLQKQIEEGAPADVFISAGKQQMKALEDKQLVDPKSVVDLLENTLVVIQPSDTTTPIKSLEEIATIDGKIAIADTASVPAGQYTKQTLEKLGIWERIQDRIVIAKDVKATLAYVEQGNVAAGFVYQSDANGAKHSSVSVTVADDLHDPILYPAAIVSSTKHRLAAEKWMDFLRGAEAKGIFEKYGFRVRK